LHEAGHDTVGEYFLVISPDFGDSPLHARLQDFFVRLAEEVGDPQGTLVLLSNSGRCGSTLLTQLFENMPNTTAISEPEVLMPFAHDALFKDVPRERRLVLIRVSLAVFQTPSSVEGDPGFRFIKIVCVSPILSVCKTLNKHG
jgi:hypothetical protein